jgi:predicted nucleotidyltransferase
MDAVRTRDPRLTNELAAALAAFPGIRLAILFGSRARGTEGAGSDVDVAVLGAGADAPEVAAALSQAVGKEIDVVPLEDPSIPLQEALVRDGVLVYEAEPGRYADWRSKTLASLETDRPWYARMRDAWLERVARQGLF